MGRDARDLFQRVGVSGRRQLGDSGRVGVLATAGRGTGATVGALFSNLLFLEMAVADSVVSDSRNATTRRSAFAELESADQPS
jgi:hypothetical protein